MYYEHYKENQHLNTYMYLLLRIIVASNKALKQKIKTVNNKELCTN